ncbi:MULTISPECIES: hypothetical protein [unclassified Novosphingobium]|uniref:hypothetical protein n=1 Tax=unclassified Novosphingobium TaxID=2644732 RepID=UPI000F7DF54C|nr:MULTISPECIES: hypothetical protein [unclassified Novosphingobium]
MTQPAKLVTKGNGTRPTPALAKANKAIAAERKFIRDGQRLLREWLKRVGEKKRVNDKRQIPIEDPDDWMRRTTYLYLKRVIEKTPRVITRLLKDLDGKHKRGPSIARQPFKQGLLLMHALPAMKPVGRAIANANSPPKLAMPKLLSDRQRRADLGDAMAYAYKHGVTSKYFNAFWRYVGMTRIKSRLHCDELEPGFSHPKSKATKAKRALPKR